MIEDLLNRKEPSRSILIIDSFENRSKNLLYTYISKFLEKDNSNTSLSIYPTNRSSKINFSKTLDQKFINLINEFILNKLFRTKQNVLRLLLDSLEQQKSQSSIGKFNLIIDNFNLILRHYDNNPIFLIQFLIECSKRPDISQVVFVAHRESLDDSILNQFKNIFQTVIYVNDTNMKQNELNMFSKLNKKIFKFNLKIDHRNLKSSKIVSYEEILFIDSEFSVQKVEKIIKTKSKLKDDEEGDDDLLKGLTFNVHLSSDDLEAKKNLVLPYELIGQKQQIKLEKRDEESKIFYAPDERDDVDDDDPDDDLNF